ncbi:MAG: hypothetical protein IPL72_06330 [Sulfuritalea sp.]|nr:hypothetical protein [Sulfuritalea sp.]
MFYDKFGKTFQYIDWHIFFSACREAVMLDYQEKHAALDKAKKLSGDIACSAAKLAGELEEYCEVCGSGRVRADVLAGGVIDDVQALIKTLRRLSVESKSYRHERYGTGKESWESRVQATDGLPQFVRFVLACLKTMYAEQMPDLTSNDLARLAIATLALKATDDDYLGKVEERVKKLKRKVG